jgi:hypothetical protein
MLRFLTAGESHGPELVTIVEGVPAGFTIDLATINHQLARRQKGYGRGGRMLIEKDEARPVSGIRFGKSLLVVAHRAFALVIQRGRADLLAETREPHLRQALDLLRRTRDRYPWQRVISHTFPLEHINEAFVEADEGRVTRAAIVP